MVWFSGCEDMPKRIFDESITSNTVPTSPGRTGDCTYIGGSTNRVRKNLPSQHQTLIIGWAGGTFLSSGTIVGAGSMNGASFYNHFSITYSFTSGAFGIYKGIGNYYGTRELIVEIPYYILGSSSAPGIWHQYEVKVTYGAEDDPSAPGAIELRVDKQVVYSNNNIDIFNSDGSALPYFDAVAWYGGSCSFFLDDIYVCDDTGDSCNDFLGYCRIYPVQPTGDGFYPTNPSVDEWSPSTGSDRYAVVDDLVDRVNNYDTYNNYIESAGVGDKATFTFDVSGNISKTLIGPVGFVSMIHNDDGLQKRLKGLVRYDGTDNNDASFLIDDTVYKSDLFVYEDNPTNSQAWTKTMLDNTEFGIEDSTV